MGKMDVGNPLIRDYILKETGEEGYEIIKFIHENEPVTIEDILESRGGNPSEARKILYKIENAHLAEYQVDTGPKGWQTFIWNSCLYNIDFIMHQRADAERKKLQHELDSEVSTLFFACPRCGVRKSFDVACETNFMCPSCREPMPQVDNRKYIERLKERIHDLI